MRLMIALSLLALIGCAPEENKKGSQDESEVGYLFVQTAASVTLEGNSLTLTGEVDFVVLCDGNPVPIQVTWEGPTERHRNALTEFYEAEPRSAEAVIVTPEAYELGLVDLA